MELRFYLVFSLLCFPDSETSQKDSSLPGSQRELQAIPMTQKHKAIMAGREDVERERKQGAEAYEYLKPENKDARTLQVFEEDAATGEFHMVQRNGNLFHSSQQVRNFILD